MYFFHLGSNLFCNVSSPFYGVVVESLPIEIISLHVISLPENSQRTEMPQPLGNSFHC